MASMNHRGWLLAIFVGMLVGIQLLGATPSLPANRPDFSSSSLSSHNEQNPSITNTTIATTTNATSTLSMISNQSTPFVRAPAVETPTTQPDNSMLKERMNRYRRVYRYRPPIRVANKSIPEECGLAPGFATYFQQPTVGPYLHRSANDEDRTIYNLFGAQFAALGAEGRYVELGAFDGWIESNTRFFDDCLGWSGLLIEGNPIKFDKLVSHRPHSHRLSFAPTCNAEQEANGTTVAFHAVAFTNGGLKGYAKDYPIDQKVVEVPCGRLTPALEDLLGGRVHFFSLDVEGSEHFVLRQIDFSRVQIDILMVESWNNHCPREPQPCPSREESRNILEAAGYRRFSDVILKSDLYIHPHSPFQLNETQLGVDPA